MTDVVDRAIRKDLGYDHTVQEFPHGASNSRTDIVGVDIDEETIRRREELFGHSKSLAESRDILETYSYIAANGPVKESEIRQSDELRYKLIPRWEWLVEHGFVETRAGLGYVVPVPIHVTAHAFELKRELSGNAIHQVTKAARRTKSRGLIYSYGTEHSLVVDDNLIEEARERLRKHTQGLLVGLFSADSSGIRRVSAPSTRPVDRMSRDLLHLNEITYAGKEPLWSQPSFADTTFAGNGATVN